MEDFRCGAEVQTDGGVLAGGQQCAATVKVTHIVIVMSKYCIHVNGVDDQKCHEKMKKHEQS